ncbi:cytochrome c [Aquibium sp. A9E412]|uniref:c-type cytochrome n=1 Tax=Aquibium sp. A9E412 TaxID=2976767 RepID=UPI0025B2297C|nr:cytochrome c [Aquibium sp. A9E412]MDN2566677.1 cytochrome c [Aquibium sp. A9E412]
MRMITTLALAGLAGALAAAPASAEEPADIAYGRALVEENCARCHGVGTDDESAHPDAPAFRTLAERYPIDALEEGFAEGIVTGHPDMPEFIASPEQIGAIIAYIESVQR